MKGALEPYEVPYNSADWAQLERTLDQGKGSGRVSRSGLYALLLGGTLAAVSSMVVLVNEPKAETAMADRGIVTERPAIAEPSIVSDVIKASPVGIEQTREPSISPKRPATAQPVDHVSTEPSAPTSTTKTPVVDHATNNAPHVKASVSEGCPGTLIEFSVDNLPEKGIYLWNFGDGSFSNKPAPSHAFSKSGSFEVMLSHSSSAGGNIRNKPAADRIIIHEAPEASFNVLKQEYENTVPSVHFENRSLGARSYAWDFGDGGTSVVAHPDHVYKKAGVYQVTLTVTNANGCLDHMEKTVRIDSDYDLLAPKRFSPNADGSDDLFMPEALKTLGVKFHLSIFDSKTGELIYETSDVQRPWNGKMSNRGISCEPGVYVWMVEMRDGDKLGGTYHGSVDLVR